MKKTLLLILALSTAFGIKPMQIQKRVSRHEYDPKATGDLEDILKRYYQEPEVAELIKKGANPNIKDRYGHPLFNTVIRDKPSLVPLMLEKGADPNTKDNSSGLYSLHYAASTGNADIARLLLDAGADVNVKDMYNCSPLCAAVRRLNRIGQPQGSYEVAKILLERGADPNDQLIVGYTPLLFAITANNDRPNKDIIRLLLQKGANPNISNPNHEADTPLSKILVRYIAKEVSSDDAIEIVSALIRYGARINDYRNRYPRAKELLDQALREIPDIKL